MTARYTEIPAGRVIWISNKVLDWGGYKNSTAFNTVNLKAHYDSYEYGASKLQDCASEMDLIASIYFLRRAVEFREKSLFEAYSLSVVARAIGASKLGVLPALGIVKPMMRDRLNSLRNEVSHDEKSLVASLDRCRELAEFTWYFLKCTDRLVSECTASITLQSESRPSNVISLDVKPREWSISFSGVISSDLVSMDRGAGGLEVTVERGSITDGVLHISGHPKPSACKMDAECFGRFLKNYFSIDY